MTKLREDVRKAFEHEQAALGDVAGVHHQLMHRAMEARIEPRSNRLQLAAVLAALLIAAIVITTFVLIRGNARSHATPASSPTAVARGLTVSDSTPILVYYELVNFEKVTAITWDGTAAGTLPFAANDYVSNPTGTLFASGGEIRDRKGTVIAEGHFGAKFFSGTWADDEFHFCQVVPFDYLTPNGTPATLQLVAPGQAPKDIANVGRVYEQTSLRVAACSVEFDRAVVVQSGGQGIGTAQYWVVQLSTGKILWTRNFQESKGSPIQVVSSRDGQTIAESQGQSTTLFGLDGAVIGHLAGAVQIFCWDGSLALVDTGTSSGPAKIVRVSDGSTVWSGPSGAGFYVYDSAAQPDGASIAVGIHNPVYVDYKGFNGPGVDLYIVAPDGHVVEELKELYW